MRTLLGAFVYLIFKAYSFYKTGQSLTIVVATLPRLLRISLFVYLKKYQRKRGSFGVFAVNKAKLISLRMINDGIYRKCNCGGVTKKKIIVVQTAKAIYFSTDLDTRVCTSPLQPKFYKQQLKRSIQRPALLIARSFCKKRCASSSGGFTN